MNKVKKLPFRTGVISHQLLGERVRDWVDALDVALLIHRNNFKYFPQFVQNLHPAFNCAAVLYSIKKRLPGVTLEGEQGVVDLSKELKEHYGDVSLGAMKKKDSFFYFLCIYFTKLTTNFLEDTFADILTETHLECEIYIALVYALIGLEVSPKSYQVNHRKIISSRVVFKSKMYLSKNDSIESAFAKPSNKKINSLQLQLPSRKLQQKCTVDRKCTFDSRNEPSDLQQFKTALHKNLLVEVLPKIPRKKIKAAEFDRMADLAQAEKAGDERRYVFTRDDNEVVRPEKTFLQSTQNSASFDLLFKNNHQINSSVHKTVKISHRPQIVTNKARKMQQFMNDVISVQDTNKNQNTCNSDSSRKNWSKIVKDLKQNTLNTTMHNSKTKWCQISAEDPLKQLDTVASIHEEKVQDLSTYQMEKEESMQGFKIRSSQMYSCWLNDKQNGWKKTKDEGNRLNSHKYRMQRRMFESLCNRRQNDAAYSMFNLRNTTVVFTPRVG